MRGSNESSTFPGRVGSIPAVDAVSESSEPSQANAMTELITWKSVDDELPDEGLIVLTNNPDECDPVWLGFLSGGVWYWSDGMKTTTPTHWAELPIGPQS